MSRMGNIIDELHGKKSTQFGYVTEGQTVDEDKWVTIKGTHVLLDDKGEIKNENLKNKIKSTSKSEKDDKDKVSKTFSKDFSMSLDAGKAVKQATGTGRLKWGSGSEKFLDRNQKGIDAIKKSITSSAKSSDEKSVAKGISKAIDVLNKEMSEFTKSEEKKSGNWDIHGNKDSCNKFYKSLKDLGVDKKQANYLSYALGLNGGSVDDVYDKDGGSSSKVPDSKADTDEDKYAGVPKKFKSTGVDPKLYLKSKADINRSSDDANAALNDVSSGIRDLYNSRVPVRAKGFDKHGSKGCVDILVDTYGEKAAPLFGVKDFSSIRDKDDLKSAISKAVSNGLDMKPYRDNISAERKSRKDSVDADNDEKKKADNERNEKLKGSRDKTISDISNGGIKVKDKEGTKKAIDDTLKFMEKHSDSYGSRSLSGYTGSDPEISGYKVGMEDKLKNLKKATGYGNKEMNDLLDKLGVNKYFRYDK